ncbi:MAG TPA: GAF domain-containing protein [Coleofasciculaceae cyanobacterium]
MPSPSHEEPLASSLEDLATALAELQTTVTKLHQRNEDLAASHQAAVNAYDRHQAVGGLARRLRQSLDSAEILNETVATVRELLQVDRAIVYHLKADNSTEIAETVHPDWAALPRTQVDLISMQQWSELDHVAKPVVIESLQQAKLPFPLMQQMQQQQVKAAVAAPILREDRLLGWLCVQQCNSERIWKLDEVESLQQLAAEVAIALQQSELYQQAQQLNADLELQVQQRTNQLQTALRFESMLKRITDKVRDSLDGSQILQSAVKELSLVLNLGGCNAALYDLDQGTSTIRYESTRSIPAYQGRVAQMDDFPEIYEQLKQGHYFQFCSLLPNPDRGRVAMLACPIFVDSQFSDPPSQSNEPEVLGDLWLIHQEDHIFHEFEIRLVQQVANQCAIAIRQAQLYQTAQKQVQELEKLNRLKDDFLSTVSHELRTPITNVKMAVKMLRIAANEDKRQRYLEILEKEANREATLIDDLLDLQRLEATSSPVVLEPIDLQTWLPSLIEPFQSRFASRQQLFQLDSPPDLPILQSNEAMLRRVLAELLNNACKYTAAGGAIHLKIQLVSSSPLSEITFQLSNQAAIPLDELPKIFDKFYRCPHTDPWSQGGTGLGLALVQKLVEQLQGTLQAESKEGWTRFKVTLAG